MSGKTQKSAPYIRFNSFLMLLITLCFSIPATALTDMQGQTKQFEDMIGKGRWTVFEVWSSECPACPDAVFYMNNLKKRYNKADLIGISVNGDYGQNGRKMAESFIKKHNIIFPNLYSDSEEVEKFLHKYNDTLYGTPSVLIFNPKGELRDMQVGAIISQDVIDFIENDQ